VAVAVLALGGALAFVLLHSPGNVSHPQISFTQPTVTTTTTPPKAPRVAVDRFQWPRYGYDAGRTRAFTGAANLHPPLHLGWRFGGNALIEFPPVIYGHTLYFVDDGATAKAVDTRTGRQRWKTHLGTLSAASPAIGSAQHLIFVPVLADHGTHPGGGRLAALSMADGHVVWSRPLPAGSESSPLVWDQRVYFGDQSGTVYCLNAANGHLNWTYHASGAVKGGPSEANGIIYFGDYSGRVYAISAFTGHQLWAVSTSGTSFGFGSGNFYSTPAVAFGRVYLGSTDGRVYSFAARTGQLAWATGTGAYVYASPSVAEIPGLGPTVFMGSYDGYFYAFNARSGQIRWRHAAGGRISGSSTIVDGVVYFSDLGSKTSAGLDARTGRQVFEFPDGAFTPVIADPTTIYLSGYDTLYQLLPARHSARKKARRISRRPARRASRRHRRRA
jgi:outer membrane protein assembly factor BamB